jgi:hypothetical protein
MFNTRGPGEYNNTSISPIRSSYLHGYYTAVYQVPTQSKLYPQCHILTTSNTHTPLPTRFYQLMSYADNFGNILKTRRQVVALASALGFYHNHLKHVFFC